MDFSSLRTPPDSLRRGIRLLAPAAALCGALLCGARPSAAQTGPAVQDTLVLSNGDTLHGRLVNEVGGTVKFHTDALGDVSVKWANVKELRTARKFAVLDKTVKLRGKKDSGEIPVGSLEVKNQAVTVGQQTGGAHAPIPVRNAAYIVDEQTLERQIYRQPNFLTGWNGTATAGATIVAATQSQYTASGSVGVVRVVPGVRWLNARNRTSADLSGSYGKITAPGTPTIKTAIFHADAERDQYFSPRFFSLAQVAFDHNFAQDLALQSVYGGGIGFTARKKGSQEIDVKASIQYEKQEFISGASTSNQNLIGSTFSASYAVKWRLVGFTQQTAYIAAYNTPHAYSANEGNTFFFPAYKNLSFSVGTLDSYLNDPPQSVPATKPNSFQFTMGLTYALKSKY